MGSSSSFAPAQRGFFHLCSWPFCQRRVWQEGYLARLLFYRLVNAHLFLASPIFAGFLSPTLLFWLFSSSHVWPGDYRRSESPMGQGSASSDSGRVWWDPGRENPYMLWRVALHRNTSAAAVGGSSCSSPECGATVRVFVLEETEKPC